MFKRLIILTLIIVNFVACSLNDGDIFDMSEAKIYIAGQYNGRACYWIARANSDVLPVRIDLPEINPNNSWASDIVVKDGNVHVVGWINDGMQRSCYWKNNNLIQLDTTGGLTEANSIIIISDTVYIVGRSYDSNPAQLTVRGCIWKNQDPICYWGDVSTIANHVIAYNNKIYVSGISLANNPYLWVFDKNCNELVSLSKDLAPASAGIAYNAVKINDIIYIAGESGGSGRVWTVSNGTSISTSLSPYKTPRVLAYKDKPLFYGSSDNNEAGYLYQDQPFHKLNVSINLNSSIEKSIVRAGNILSAGRDLYLGFTTACYWINDRQKYLEDGTANCSGNSIWVE
jgi:hypothetical protein